MQIENTALAVSCYVLISLWQTDSGVYFSIYGLCASYEWDRVFSECNAFIL